MMRPFLPLSLAVALILSPGKTLAAPTLLVSPAAVTNNFMGGITLQIGAISPGEKITIEKFVDLNNNGAVEAADVLIESYAVTDGLVRSIGGVRNYSIPGDEDLAANGQIHTVLNFAAAKESSRIAGSFVYRITAPSGTVTKPFSVIPAPYPQKVTGRVTANGAGLAGAGVALLQPQRDERFVAGIYSDANGNFTLPAPVGNYGMVALSPGYLASFETPTMVSLAAGQTFNANVAATPGGPRKISGRIVDAASPSIGLAGLQIFASSDAGLVTLGLSDAQGNFTLPVTSGHWELKADEPAVAQLGYVTPSQDVQVDTTAGDAFGVSIPLSPGVSLLYGTLLDQSNNPLPGIPMEMSFFDSRYRVKIATDAAGHYSAAVPLGQWVVNGDGGITQSSDFLISSDSVQVNAAGAAFSVNLRVASTPSRILGSVKNKSGQGVQGIGVFAVSGMDSAHFETAKVRSDASGNFTINVFQGLWQLWVDDDSLREQGYLSANSPDVQVLSTTASASIILTAASTHLRGQLLDQTGAPVPNMEIFAWSPQNPSSSAMTGSDGRFDLGVLGGEYHVGTDQSEASLRNYVPSFLTVQAQDGVDQNNLVVRVRQASSTLTVSLRDPSNAPLALSGIQAYFGTAPTNSLYYSGYPGETDASGATALKLFPGNWNVNVNWPQDWFPPGENSSSSTSITVTGSSASISFKVPDSVATPRLNTTSIPVANLGVQYTWEMSISGYGAPYAAALAPGSGPLPPGLSLNSGAGQIVGIPTQAGTYQIAVRLTGQRGPSLDVPVSLIVRSGGAEPDVAFLYVEKRRQMRQTGGALNLDGATPFRFGANAEETSPGSIISKILTLPNGSQRTLSGGDGLDARFADAASLEAAYPSGTYNFSLVTQNNGIQVLQLPFPQNTFPDGLIVANLSAAQQINAAAPFTLQWSLPVSPGPNDFLRLQIRDNQGQDIFESPGPGRPGALTGSSTSFTIPAGTLASGKTYEAGLSYTHIITMSQTNGVTELAGYTTETRFTLAAAGTGDVTPPQLVSSSPANGGTALPTTAPLIFVFSEPMQPSYSINWSSNVDGPRVNLTWSSDKMILIAQYPNGWPAASTITWELNPPGVGSNFKDLAGNPLASGIRGTFSTAGNAESPKLTLLPITADRGFQFQVSAQSAGQYQVQTSTNLTTWTDIGVTLLPGETFKQIITPGPTRTFYRLRSN